MQAGRRRAVAGERVGAVVRAIVLHRRDRAAVGLNLRVRRAAADAVFVGVEVLVLVAVLFESPLRSSAVLVEVEPPPAVTVRV